MSTNSKFSNENGNGCFKKKSLNEFEQLMKIVREEIESNPDKIITTTELAEKHNLTVKELQNNFKHFNGMTVKDCSLKSKLKHLDTLIEKDDPTNPSIAYSFALQLGYTSESSLTSMVSRLTGMNYSCYYLHVHAQKQF